MPEILGVRIDNLNKTELDAKLRSFLAEPKFHKVFTPNAEILLEAHRNPAYKKSLRAGDLNLVDGVGVLLVGKILTLLNAKSRQTNWFRTTGVDTLLTLCRLAAVEQKSVLFFGADPGIADRAADKMQKKHPTLSIRGFDPGRVSEQAGKWSFENGSVETIMMMQPAILAVALGHPKQEQLICSLSGLLPSVRIAIGVGGALDYISGNVKRAPKWMRRLGFEWLYRLYQQPSRIKRIFNAVVVFPLTVIWDKIKAL